MRTALATAAIAAGIAAPAMTSTASACEYQLGKICVPSTCGTVATAVTTANNAAGQPLGPATFPHCID